MRRLLLFSAAALIVAASGAFATESAKGKLVSGLQPGTPAGAFNVLDITGPNKGKKLCYR